MHISSLSLFRRLIGAASAFVMGVLLFSGQPTFAQQRPTPPPTPDTRLPTFALPLTSLGYYMRIAPNELTLVLFNNQGFYRGVPDGDLTNITLFDTLLGDPILTLRGATDFALDVVYTPDSAALVSYHQNGDLNIWDTTSGDLLRTVRTFYIDNFSRLYATNDGERVIIFNRGVTAPSMILNLTTGAVEQFIGLHYASLNDLRVNSETFASFGAETQFIGFAVAPDEARMYFANGNADIFRWDADGRELVVWREPDDKTAYEQSFAIRRMAFSPDGAIMVLSDELRGELRWIDVATGAVLGSISGIDLPAFALSPDASHIAWVNRRAGAVYLAPLTPDAAPRLIATFDPSHQATPNTTLTFTADSSTLYIGGLSALSGSNAVYVIDLRGVES
ncbi:MAG: hypothetical protein SGI73_07625 [Chloroflexota bacterium]|nr:hypothetical protein [Chloroflexota bacterium]